ncbi:MAG: tetratricopeptide repeat protein, partial [Candidatus Latescibacteria bacterium]|nr:tetratricopeptide repeat protein [Candidatus Latescibacterota bacterium]
GTGVPTEALNLLTRAKDILGTEDLATKMVEAEINGYSSKAAHVTQSYMGYVHLLAACQKAGDSLRVGHCAMRLGRVDGATGGHGGALQNFERGARIFEALGDVRMHAWALRNMGHAQRKLGHYDVAQDVLEKALDLARKTKTQNLEIRVLNDLSRMAMERGHHDQAVSYEKGMDTVLRALQADIIAGRNRDSVMLDFYHLLKLRYASLLPYETDMYVGFYDQLIWANK